MADFPTFAATPQKTIINVFGPNGMVGDPCFGQNLVANVGLAWPATNRALYVAFWVEQIMVARRLFCRVTTQSGNLDMGLYDNLGNRIVSKGSTAVAAANTTQIIDITASVTGTASPVLRPGWYFIALCVDNLTAAFMAATLSQQELCRLSGVQQQAVGAVTLPATATLANPATAYVPNIGLSSTPL